MTGMMQMTIQRADEAELTEKSLNSPQSIPPLYMNPSNEQHARLCCQAPPLY